MRSSTDGSRTVSRYRRNIEKISRWRDKGQRYDGCGCYAVAIVTHDGGRNNTDGGSVTLLALDLAKIF